MANNVLKQYIMNGYAVNEKRLAALNKTAEIQSKIIANTLEIEEAAVLFCEVFCGVRQC